MSPHRSDDWISADRRHVWHPYTQMQTAPAPLPVVRGEGVYLHTTDGRRILDGISSWWVNIHGHNHPALNRALAEQASRLAQVIFAGCTHEPGARLAERLSALAPGTMPRVFYSDDGSTAVEAALKMAFQYWRNRGQDRRRKFVAFENAYHGDTLGCMSVGGVLSFRETFRDLLFEVRTACAPTSHAWPLEKTRAECAVECAGDLESVLEREGDEVAAVIIEPRIQGAGGMIVTPVEHLRRIRNVTRAHGIPLIADEVFTGFGRTGTVFACEHGPVEPDILCLSKALTGGYLPLAATLCTQEIYEAFLGESRSRAFLHGHSFTGNALSCAVALESIGLLEETIAAGRLTRLGELFARRTEGLRGLPGVLDARCLGVMAAVELEPSDRGGYLDDLGPRLAREFLSRDILLRPLGNVLYFLPPYVIRDEEVERVFDTMEEVLRKLGG